MEPVIVKRLDRDEFEGVGDGAARRALLFGAVCGLGDALLDGVMEERGRVGGARGEPDREHGREVGAEREGDDLGAGEGLLQVGAGRVGDDGGEVGAVEHERQDGVGGRQGGAVAPAARWRRRGGQPRCDGGFAAGCNPAATLVGGGVEAGCQRLDPREFGSARMEDGDAGVGGLLDEEGTGALAVAPAAEAEGIGAEGVGEFISVEGEGEEAEEAGKVGAEQRATVCEEEEGAPLCLRGGERDERAGQMGCRPCDASAVILQSDGGCNEGAGGERSERGALDERGDDGSDSEVVGGVSAGGREEPELLQTAVCGERDARPNGAMEEVGVVPEGLGGGGRVDPLRLDERAPHFEAAGCGRGEPGLLRAVEKERAAVGGEAGGDELVALLEFGERLG